MLLDGLTIPSELGGIPQLSFESCFEGGNLRAAVQVYENEYDLFLATDLNDRSECGNLCQWFYFSVAGMQPGVAYKFNVVNFKKKASLFGNGKQPLVCRGGSVPQPAGAASASSGSGGGASASGGSGGGAGDAACASGGSPADEAHASGGSPADGARASSGGGGGTGGGGRSGWYRAGTNVAYYPSPYRGRTAATASAARSKKGCSGKKGGAAAGSGAAGKKGAGGAGGDTGGSSSASKGGDAAAGGAGTGDKAATAAGLTLSDAGPGLHCCTFTLQFDVGGTYYLASCFPYGYSDLQEFVDGVMTRAVGGQEGGEQAAAAAAGAAAAGAAGVSEPGASGAEQPVIVRSLLCYSLLGQRVDMLTVTDFSAPPEVVRQREVVAITARVHPGETCASWIMQGFIEFLVSSHLAALMGFIEFLVSSHPTATALRASFVFKLVPMLNPDGVANGSYRCSMSGQDLNRTWDRPLKWVHPTIYHTKKVLQQLAAAGRLALFIDVHGHSTKEDTFFYGCEPSTPGGQGGKAAQTQQSAAAKASPADSGAPLTSNGASSGGPGAWDPSASATAPWPSTAVDGQPPLPQPPSATQQPPAMCASGAGSSAGGGGGGQALNARAAARMRVRMLPYLASRVSPDFSMARSNFKIRKAKLGAGRVVVNRELGVAGSYTLEASLGGQSTERRHFSARDYVLQGHNLARAIAELAEVDDAALLEEMSAAITLPQ
ncbi:hypothetical protein FOA52_007930 [Chlamydomonas sp. UWO 241]|nr:hypothetical protein FOA52_007930 [Chlamydomonas sp. UWO 241]